MYVEHIVECFRAVKRVLRDDGTLWLNCGDSYGKSSASGPQGQTGQRADRRFTAEGCPATGMAKQLIGQPWRVAFALQADGWYLRSDIIWHKPNPMPESVSDRPTRAHEYLFLLTKQKTYYYDAEAIKETNASQRPTDWQHLGPSKAHNTGEDLTGGAPNMGGNRQTSAGLHRQKGGVYSATTGRNKRSVWIIPTEANPEAHFASFPRKLVLPCVRAGTSEKGCCPECLTPWVRMVEKTPYTPPVVADGVRNVDASRGDKTRKLSGAEYNQQVKTKTLGWKPGCECVDHRQVLYEDGTPSRDISEGPFEPVPCTVLDCFVGSGQAGIVATQQGRRFIGIDASAEYCEMARRRIANPEPEPETPDVAGQMMFDELEPEVRAVAPR